MSDIFRNGRFEPDTWRVLDEGEAIPPEGHVLVTLERWLIERAGLLGDNRPLGVVIPAGEHHEEIGPDVGRLAVIALPFARFQDGRAFSVARLLRERFGFRGELRAMGDVLTDQIPFMLRCGFDAFVVTHEGTRAALAAGQLAEVVHYYQPVGIDEPPAGTRPWTRTKLGN